MDTTNARGTQEYPAGTRVFHAEVTKIERRSWPSGDEPRFTHTLSAPFLYTVVSLDAPLPIGTALDVAIVYVAESE